ncbi:MAG: sortase [candidate division Zixibacteria bacterium]|nr:sortase [candidate division Zixibacteria bacterium]
MPLDGYQSEPEDDGSGTDLKKRRGRKAFDAVLLIIELAAVAGLIFMLFNGMEVIRDLNSEVAQAIIQPTLSPTPQIRPVVLPSGHTPPTSPGGARFNEDEIPEHLRPLVQSRAQIPIPTPGPEQAVRIQIPAINVDAPVVQGDGEEQLKKGVGQFIGSANPGKKGNLILSAHNDIFGEIFRELDLLEPGDEVIVYSAQRAYTYVVANTLVVDPLRVDVMDPTNNPTITLISCYPYLIDDQRIIVQGNLQNE